MSGPTSPGGDAPAPRRGDAGSREKALEIATRFVQRHGRLHEYDSGATIHALTEVIVAALDEAQTGSPPEAPRSARGGGDADAVAREIRNIREAIEAYRWEHARPEGREHCIACGAWMTDGCKPACFVATALRSLESIAAALRERVPSAYPFGGLAGLLREVEQSLRSHGAECLNPESCGPLGCLLAKIHHQRVALERRAPASPSESEAGGAEPEGRAPLAREPADYGKKHDLILTKEEFLDDLP